MDKISGVPAHPLLVHIPVVLIPLAAIGALVMLVWPKSRRHIGWITAGIAAVGALGAILAASAGEGLEELLDEHSAALRHHAELGEGARTYSIIFAIVIIAFVVWEYMTHKKAAAAAGSGTSTATSSRTRNLILAASIVTVLAGGMATYTVYDAGHTGAKSTWGDAGQESSSDESGTPTNDGVASESTGDRDND